MRLNGYEADDAKAAAPIIKRLEKELAKAIRGGRLQRPLSVSQLPAGFVEASDPTITIPASAGQPTFEMGKQGQG